MVPRPWPTKVSEPKNDLVIGVVIGTRWMSCLYVHMIHIYIPGEPIDTQISAQRGFDTQLGGVSCFHLFDCFLANRAKTGIRAVSGSHYGYASPSPVQTYGFNTSRGDVCCVCCVCSGIFTKKAWLSTGQPRDKVVEIWLHPHVLGKPWTCWVKSILDPRPCFSSLLSCHGSFAWSWHPSKAMPSADGMGSAGCCAAACGHMWAADVYFREAYPSDLYWQWWTSDASYQPIRPIACISKWTLQLCKCEKVSVAW